MLLCDRRVNPAANENEAIRMASREGHSAVVALLLGDPRVNPAAYDNGAIRLASREGRVEVVKMLLRDSRANPAVNDNELIRSAVRSRSDLPHLRQLTDSVQLKLVKLLLCDKRVDPTAQKSYALRCAKNQKVAKLIIKSRAGSLCCSNSVLQSVCRDGRADIAELLLCDERVDPSADNNWAIRAASLRGRLEVVDMLLSDPRVNPAAEDNEAMRRAVSPSTSDPHVKKSAQLKLIQLLLRDERVDPSVNENKALRIVNVAGCVPTFELLMRDARVKMSLFFPTDSIGKYEFDQIYTDGSKGKLLIARFKQIYKTAVFCFNRVWQQRGLKVPNDVVRLVVSEWCRTVINVRHR
jgi:hypothetical protein